MSSLVVADKLRSMGDYYAIEPGRGRLYLIVSCWSEPVS